MSCPTSPGASSYGRGGYICCLSRTSEVAWCLGLWLLPLGFTLAAVGAFKFNDCDVEYSVCESANWYQSGDLCYDQFVDVCYGLRW